MQSPYFWPSQHHTPDHIEYAIYLYKRAQKNKKIHGLEPGLPVLHCTALHCTALHCSTHLWPRCTFFWPAVSISLTAAKTMHSDEEIISQDYENDALVHLKRILQNKWDFVVMQAEEQVGAGEARRWRQNTTDSLTRLNLTFASSTFH